MTSTKPFRILSPPQIPNLAGALFLVCSLQSYGQPVHPLEAEQAKALVAKAAAGEEARAYSTPLKEPAASGVYVTFDVPGALNGTFPAAVNHAGDVTGSYSDANGAHGFLRTQKGEFLTFDVPGSVTGTFPGAINPSQTIAGSWCDAYFNCHGFVRLQNGAISKFDVPGASDTVPIGISPSGEITGFDLDPNLITDHGFLRTRDATITTIDPVSFTTVVEPSSISPNETVLGVYCVASGCHGMLRYSDGAVTTFDPPGPIASGPLRINPMGAIVGSYFQVIPGNPFGGNYRGFLRSPDVLYTTFDAASYPPCCIWTTPTGINQAGTIVGSYNDGFNLNHGFLRSPDGTITTFDVPGAGTGNFQGTLPFAINQASTVFGLYRDAASVSHGFIYQP